MPSRSRALTHTIQCQVLQDQEGVALFHAKPGLVLVKKALEGFDVHFVVQIYNLFSRLLNLWHSDWFSD